MKKLLYIFIFTVIASAAWQSHAQSVKTDSLKKILLTAKEDTNKVNTLNGLAREMELSGDYEKGINYAGGAKQLAEKINLPDGSHGFKKGIANAYGNFGNLYYHQGDYAKALKNYFTALKIDEALNNKTGIAKRLGNIGNVYNSQADYPKALDYYFKALKMAEELGDKNRIAIWLGNIGNVYNSQADYPKALDYYFKALKIGEELGDKNGIARHLGNIGVVYWNQADYPKALDYYFKALKIGEELDDKNGIARHLGNIGIVYMEQADYPKALDYYFKALKMAQELGNKNSIASWLGNIGNVYKEQANYPKASPTERSQSFGRALDYYFKALKMAQELGNKNGIAIQLGNIGSLYKKTGKFAEAEKYLKDALDIDTAIRSLEHIRFSHQELSQLYDTTGRTKLAFEHYKKYIAARDSITNDENTKKETRTAMLYDFDKKQTADSVRNVEILKQENLKHEQQIKQQKIYTYGGAIGFALMLVVAGVSFRAYRNKQKANEIISKQKKLVEEKQKEILDSIYYARRIQRSLLTSEKYIEKSLKKNKSV